MEGRNVTFVVDGNMDRVDNSGESTCTDYRQIKMGACYRQCTDKHLQDNNDELRSVVEKVITVNLRLCHT